MGKVWIKTKYDTGMGMDIPHSPNFAQAMYGFKELGAEIKTYHLIDDFYEKVSDEDIVVDYVDQCQEIFKKFGVYPEFQDYPDVMKEYLGRKIWKDTISSIADHEEKWSAGYFVKPVKTKMFTGKIISTIYDLCGTGNSNEDYEVWVSEPVSIAAEWRCFIMYDRILDIRPYGLVSGENYDGYKYHYDYDTVRDMLNRFITWDDRPAACSMDICVTKEGKTLLVEMNDAYALGCYGLHSLFYAKFLSARWSQLMNRKDEYTF